MIWVQPIAAPTGLSAFGVEPADELVDVGKTVKVNIPADVVVQLKKPRKDRLPVLVQAKSAGDFTNTNKRRKEEATKVHQLRFGVSCGVRVPVGSTVIVVLREDDEPRDVS